MISCRFFSSDFECTGSINFELSDQQCWWSAVECHRCPLFKRLFTGKGKCFWLYRKGGKLAASGSHVARHNVLSSSPKRSGKIFKSEICWEVWGDICLIELLGLIKCICTRTSLIKAYLCIIISFILFIYFTMNKNLQPFAKSGLVKCPPSQIISLSLLQRRV